MRPGWQKLQCSHHPHQGERRDQVKVKGSDGSKTPEQEATSRAMMTETMSLMNARSQWTSPVLMC